MASKMTLALEFLRDGEWHSLEELQDAVELNGHQAEGFVDFLHEYDLATRDRTKNQVKLTRRFQELLWETLTV